MRGKSKNGRKKSEKKSKIQLGKVQLRTKISGSEKKLIDPNGLNERMK